MGKDAFVLWLQPSHGLKSVTANYKEQIPNMIHGHLPAAPQDRAEGRVETTTRASGRSFMMPAISCDLRNMSLAQ